MRFYKRRDQAARIWDPKKGENGAVSIVFTKQTRDKFGIDGFYDTDKKPEIALLNKMGYECDELQGEGQKDEPEAG